MVKQLVNEVLSHKIRFLKTSILAFSFLILGSTVAVIGPTLLDLRQAVAANALQISVIFPIGSIGYLLGSIAGGLVYEKCDSQLTMALFCTIMSVCQAVVPWNRSIAGLSITLFVMGLGGGGLDAAGNVWLLHMWGKSSGPFMQALHFSFGLGAFFAPLIAEPFLTKRKNVTEEIEDMEMEPIGSRELLWCPYMIISALGVVTVISLVIMYFVKSSDKPHPSIVNGQTLNQMSLRKKILILTIACVVFHSYCGLEIAFGRFMTTFVYYSDLRLNKSVGAYMTSVFWGTFTLCRLLSVFIVALIGNKTMILADLTIILTGNCLLFIFGNTSETGVWIGVALMGVGASAIFPTLFSFIEELIPVTSRIGSLFLVVSCLGEFTIPFIVGSYVEREPLVLVYVTTIAGGICFIFFAILCLITKTNPSDAYQKTAIADQIS